MNTRIGMLGIVGVTTVVATGFLFFKMHNPGPSHSPQAAVLSTKTDAEEEIRTALNDIGQFIVNSYAAIDCINEELDILPANRKQAQTIIQKTVESLNNFNEQIAADEFSINNRLKELTKQIATISIDEDIQAAFLETIQDFYDQQEQLIAYVQDTQKRVALAAETINLPA